MPNNLGWEILRSGYLFSSKSLVQRCYTYTHKKLSKICCILSVLRSLSQSLWSRNYLRPGAGAEMIFLINIYCSQFGRCMDEENIISNISCYRGVWIFIQKNSVSTYKNAWLLGSSLYIYNKCCRTFTRRVWTDECVVSTTSLWGLIFFVLIFGNFFLLMFCLVRILMTTLSRHY